MFTATRKQHQIPARCLSAQPTGVGKAIGISQTHLSNIEHCHVKINLKLLLRIANAFGCTMENIFDARTFPESAEAKAASAKAHKTSGQEVYMREEVQQILQMLYLYKN